MWITFTKKIGLISGMFVPSGYESKTTNKKYHLPLINLFYRSSQSGKKSGYQLNLWVLIVSNI
jgi:hypothetical protein